MLPFEVFKIVDVNNVDDANVYIETGRWKLLDTVAAKRWDNEICVSDVHILLGWLGPEDPERPELDDSQFPELSSVEPDDLPEWS